MKKWYNSKFDLLNLKLGMKYGIFEIIEETNKKFMIPTKLIKVIGTDNAGFTLAEVSYTDDFEVLVLTNEKDWSRIKLSDLMEKILAN